VSSEYRSTDPERDSGPVMRKSMSDRMIRIRESMSGTIQEFVTWLPRGADVWHSKSRFK